MIDGSKEELMIDKSEKPDIRILLIEDSPDDAELIKFSCRQGGLNAEWHWVDSKDALGLALNESWHVIVSDYRMPGFGAEMAIEMIRARNASVPVIVVSHDISEDDTLKLLDLGADDVLKKSARAVLPRIIKRRLSKFAGHAHRNAFGAMAASPTPSGISRLFESLTGRGRHGVVVVSPDGQIDFANENAEKILGLKQDAITQHYYHDRDPWLQIDRERNTLAVEDLPLSFALKKRSSVNAYVHGIVLPTGEVKWLSVSASPIHAPDGDLISAVASFEDVSEKLNSATN
jgi:PAS domain S-box-containing protein